MKFTGKCIILDACCVITLFASQRFRGIVEAIPAQVAACRYVVEKEAGFVYDGPEENIRSEKVPIDLNPCVEEGLVHVSTLRSEDEMGTFVRLAGRMDDGEARTLALATHRNWMIATDDHRAIRGARDAELQVITTPEIIRHWANTTNADANILAQVLTDVESRGAYSIGRRHDLYHWWHKYK